MPVLSGILEKGNLRERGVQQALDGCLSMHHVISFENTLFCNSRKKS